MRCLQCENIPLVDIKSPADYIAALEAFSRMENAGFLEKVYENFPIEAIFTGNTGGKTKFFHQYRCTNCSTVYGMFVNTTIGGQKYFFGIDFRTVKQIFDTTRVSICEGSYYLYKGQNLTEQGIYRDTLAAQNGCDSIHTLILTVNQPYFHTIHQDVLRSEAHTS